MSARTHVCVALLLAACSATGCLFGGGDAKKRAPRAAGDNDPAQAGDPAQGDVASGGSSSPQSDRANTPAEGQGQASAADPARADAAAPQDSAVIWPDPESLRLSDGTADAPARVANAGEASPPPPAERAAGPMRTEEQDLDGARAPADGPADAEASEAVVVDQGDAPHAQPRPAEGAVAAHRPLNLAEPTVTATPAADGEMEVNSTAGGADDLSRRMAQRLRDNPGDLAVHLDYQLLRYLNDEPVPDLNAIDDLPGEDRELLLTLIDGLSNFRNAIRSDANMLLSAKIRPLLETAMRLRSQADLSIRKLALCERVIAFGNYKPMKPRFVAGRKNEALVYCELGNVSSRQNDNGEWESTLGQEAVLYTADGQPIWSNPRRSVPDRSRSRRQDFFVIQQITLPPNLGIGRYILKVTVYDEQVKRLAEANVDVDIVAQLEPPSDVVAGDPQSSPPPTTGRSRKAAPGVADGGPPAARRSTNAIARELRAARTAAEREQPARGEGDGESNGVRGGTSNGASDEASEEAQDAELSRTRDDALRRGGRRIGQDEVVE